METITEKKIFYPESDGQPISTQQFDWITLIKHNLEAVFAAENQVFVAGDLLWYPVEGQPRICQAPDVLVAFGVPKGERGSYRQWAENGITPQVVFEIVSKHDSFLKMLGKLQFYEQYGVEEYYQYDLFRENDLSGWLRNGDELQPIADMQNWVSPRLNIRFETVEGELKLYRPDGRLFQHFQELEDQNRRLAERLRQMGIDPEAV
jgi:Uma2 family endonuclease